MKKVRVSTKIGLAAIVLAVGGYYGQKVFSNYAVGRENFSPVAPGRVNLVGINPRSGYRIIVANDIAQLVETQGGFGGSEKGDSGPTDGAIKRRVPMKELLGVLRGDSKALGNFVMIMNGMQENEDWPPVRVVWHKDEIEKAIAGDPNLRKKLEHDLNVRLDGTPIVPLVRNSLENGIIVASPVEMTVNVDGKPTLVRSEVMEPYKPAVIKATEAHYQDKANVDNSTIAGYYALEIQSIQENPVRKENIAETLRRMTSKATMESRLEAPRHVLESATVVLNERYIEDARYKSYKTAEGKQLNDLTVDLNDEGRRRLWKFSLNRVGGQILLVANDIPIAAPRIEHELALSEFTITQMPDEVLVRDAVDTIKGGGRMAQK